LKENIHARQGIFVEHVISEVKSTQVEKKTEIEKKSAKSRMRVS
jgi:hypothetical protein